ncbi:MAG: penicillin-binding transpeptidase domain-containing protein, partial [Oscillospiraceae bacterium]|nr:penicillin-binding transpeptidase domain-containing protein [Oscillospiraceae bacterium]
SVFKMCTASMGREEGVVTESTPFYCSGSIDVEGTQIHCWKSGGHGSETFEEAVLNSCNPQFATLGLELGNHTFFKYFEGFGFTKATGIDLPGEPTSYSYYKAEELNKVSLAVEAFGQNFKITPVQMITACAAVANGGYLVQPHVVKEIVDADGNIVKTASTTTKRQVISTSTSKRVAAILQKDAVAGTAKNGYIPGYRIAGKTGTSEKVDKDNQLKAKTGTKGSYYVASYCGFAPADDPQYALLVFCDESNGSSYYGNSVSGPIFNKIMTEVLPYLGVEPKYTSEEQQKLAVKTPDTTGKTVAQAKTAIAAANGELKVHVYGNGSTVIQQLPTANSSIPRGGTVALFTSEDSCSQTVTVPNFINGSNNISTVESLASESGLNISVSGISTTDSTTSAVAISQSVAAGQKVQPGTVITVTFAEQSNSG